MSPSRHRDSRCQEQLIKQTAKRHLEAVGGYYQPGWKELVFPKYSSGTSAPGTTRDRFKRMLDAAPSRGQHPRGAVWMPWVEGTSTRTSGSSIYPAVQNMLLAARALGSEPR